MKHLAARVRQYLTGWVVTAFVLSAAWAARCDAQVMQDARYTLPKPCWDAGALHGRDTVFLYLPCNALGALDSATRAAVDCTLARGKAGGWSYLVYETRRSDALQWRYYQRGRTVPGVRVTNAMTARQSAHGTGFAVDIIHATKRWDAPARFWWWLGYHAEQCGLEAGYYWTRFPDAPHVQARTWRKR